MDTAIVLFTRDLRVHDNPALAGGCARARQVVPLFVVDLALDVPPNRARFLAESVAALREELRGLGGDLVIRVGDPVAETIRLATEVKAGAVFVAGDVSRYAARRERRLAAECATDRVALEVTPGHQVVPAGDLQPGGGGHYRVFTPYWRAWSAATWRRQHATPAAVSLPAGIAPGRLPARGTGASKGLAPGGERAGKERARAWLDGSLKGYAGQHDALAADDTSRLSAYLRFGCVSPLALPTRRCRTRAVKNSAGSWPGGTSSTRSRPPSRISRPGTTGRVLAAPRTGRRTPARSTPGGPGRPVARSSTPGCGSWPPKGSCTTGHG